MSYVLGIDGGGTKTVCVLMDKHCKVKGRGEAGPSNYQTVGIEAASHAIRSAIVQAAAAVEAKTNFPPTIEAIGLGLAGIGRPEDIPVAKTLVQQLQSGTILPVNWSLQPDGLAICNDCAIALVGGTGSNVGIAVIAGTGAVTYGQNRQGALKRCSGWGYLLGDEGSAYHIAMGGMRAAMRSHDGRCAPTSLVSEFQTQLGLNSIEELVEVVYRRGWSVREIAALAPVVDQAAAAGDPVANEIISQAVTELVLATRVTMEALFTPQDSFEIVTSGGVWKSLANLRDRFIAGINNTAYGSQVDVIWPRNEPAYGAGLMVLSQLGNIHLINR